jgi:hypothetical protein
LEPVELEELILQKPKASMVKQQHFQVFQQPEEAQLEIMVKLANKVVQVVAVDLMVIAEVKETYHQYLLLKEILAELQDPDPIQPYKLKVAAVAVQLDLVAEATGMEVLAEPIHLSMQLKELEEAAVVEPITYPLAELEVPEVAEMEAMVILMESLKMEEQIKVVEAVDTMPVQQQQEMAVQELL